MASATWSMLSLRAVLPSSSFSSSSSSPSTRCFSPSIRLSRSSIQPSRSWSHSARGHSPSFRVSALPAFSGLSIANRLNLGTAMRHGKRVPKLGRPADQRRALLRGLTTELLRHGRIKTTRAKARAMRKHVDHMITLAKGGSLHQRRQALGFIYDKQLVHALFAEVPDRYGERNGGYTRIIRTMPRRGDCAPMAFIELV
ncbi:hypothetical protein O6H91_14G039800 [Diphasiastrum complanatum]|uniref:Uncharacterized protein n=1 Tax=Diphasiastrum complanatum TaxID=34168 RepID=A0ACC2BNE8_DIPCM|nr:hypothetical protein O6H91_14G039800 [Diphasiastrum complanatum]